MVATHPRNLLPPLLKDPRQSLLHDQAHIFSAARKLLKTIHGSLHIPAINALLSTPFRERDSCLMDVLSALPNVTRAKLEACNRVRLYYGVFYLSELTTADGGSIARNAWEGSHPRFSPLLWPLGNVLHPLYSPTCCSLARWCLLLRPRASDHPATPQNRSGGLQPMLPVTVQRSLLMPPPLM
jgi:hypothetical protein